MKYVFVFAVFLVLLGLSSAASVSGRSLKNKLQRLQTARRENLLARRLQGLQRRDGGSGLGEYFGSGSGFGYPGEDSSDMSSGDIDEMCGNINYILEDEAHLGDYFMGMTDQEIEGFFDDAIWCMMMSEFPFRRSLLENLKAKAKK